MEDGGTWTMVGAGGVAGVRVRARGEGGESELSADLVVDAAGRNSRAPEWLKALGYDTPAETVVDAKLGYASRLYRRAEGFRAPWPCLYFQASPPDQTRGAVLFPVEGGRWLVSCVVCTGTRRRRAVPVNQSPIWALLRGARQRLRAATSK